MKILGKNLLILSLIALFSCDGIDMDELAKGYCDCDGDVVCVEEWEKENKEAIQELQADQDLLMEFTEKIRDCGEGIRMDY